MPSILIVDDHDLVRTGLRGILEGTGDLTIAGEAGSGDEAIRLNRELAPDVILMDVGMPGLSGFETTERILAARPDARIIILTAHGDTPFPATLLDLGARGFLTKDCAAGELLAAIDAVCQGRQYIGSEIAQQLAISLLPGQERSPFESLSGREMEVVLMLTRGMELTEIAETMSLSRKTVATYKYRVFDKTGVDNEVELLREAIRHGVIREPA